MSEELTEGPCGECGAEAGTPDIEHEGCSVWSYAEIERLQASLRAKDEALAVAEKALEKWSQWYQDTFPSVSAVTLDHPIMVGSRALSTLKNKPALEHVRVAREKLIAEVRSKQIVEFMDFFDDYDAALRDAGMAP